MTSEIVVLSSYDHNGMLVWAGLGEKESNQPMTRQDWNQIEPHLKGEFKLFDKRNQTPGLIQDWLRLVLKWIPCQETENSFSIWAHTVDFPALFKSNIPPITLGKKIDSFFLAAGRWCHTDRTLIYQPAPKT